MLKFFTQIVLVFLAVALTLNKSSSTFAVPVNKARNFLNNFKPVLFANVLDENTATTEAATTNALEIEAANSAQTAATFDHENASTLLLKRNFLGGFKPVVFIESLDENTATTEAATTNELDIEAANAAQTAATFDHENASTVLVNKRNFLGGFKPVLFANVLDENTATTEAATTNALDIEAANSAQTAADFDHEHAETDLFQL
ncbi:2836_t:CDS:1 [Ambispora leptoticha]|uniref:2836_t:CDS:1 n=1 Tax=Ambispora leptoticha TaxID=144679 RepID=A0A9N8W3U2_9GLOM|nr:2836_t:CDS:1 [Ambispora leptoticha]